MAYDQAEDLRQQRQDERDARIQEAREVRRAVMGRNPTLKPMNQRSSSLARIPLIGFFFQFLAGLMSRIGVRNVARRQRPLMRLPIIPRSPAHVKGNLAKHARTRFPGYPGKMGRAAFRGPNSTTFGPDHREPFGPRHPEINRRPSHLRTPQKPNNLRKRMRA